MAKIDQARLQSDKQLKNIEKEMGRIYGGDPALKRAEKELKKYLQAVGEKTKDTYAAYKAETDRDRKAELKKAYQEKVFELTRNSKEYRAIIDRYVSALSDANQKALDIVNDNVADTYLQSHNIIAAECRRVGIKVNG